MFYLSHDYTSSAASTTICTMVVMEHPERSWIPNAPSSWLLPELSWGRSLPNATAISLDQCMFEAPSQKPATLFCFDCDAMGLESRRAPNQGKCNHRSHATVLIGRRPDGTFTTAPSKQYPGTMNKFLAKVSQELFFKTLPLSGQSRY